MCTNMNVHSSGSMSDSEGVGAVMYYMQGDGPKQNLGGIKP